MAIVKGLVTETPFSEYPDMTGVTDWVIDLMAQNDGHFPTSFSEMQQNQYMDFLENFQQYNAQSSPSQYGAPIDQSGTLSAPYALFDILSKSTCYQ